MTTKEPASKKDKKEAIISEAQVMKFLKDHPAFFKRHPDLLSVLTPPERDLGDGVVDFQHFQLKSLQNNTRQLKNKYEGLIDFCRDNLSAQSEVHEAVLRVIRTRSLEQLLEVLAIDLPALFDLDIVRIAVESPNAETEENDMEGLYHSGIVMVAPGTIDLALNQKAVLLVDDSETFTCDRFEDIFVGGESLARSYALLKLTLEKTEYPVVLAFGIRTPGRFHSGQGVDLLMFLSQVIATHIDRYLVDLAI